MLKLKDLTSGTQQKNAVFSATDKLLLTAVMMKDGDGCIIYRIHKNKAGYIYGLCQTVDYKNKVTQVTIQNDLPMILKTWNTLLEIKERKPGEPIKNTVCFYGELFGDTKTRNEHDFCFGWLEHRLMGEKAYNCHTNTPLTTRNYTDFVKGGTSKPGYAILPVSWYEGA